MKLDTLSKEAYLMWKVEGGAPSAHSRVFPERRLLCISAHRGHFSPAVLPAPGSGVTRPHTQHRTSRVAGRREAGQGLSEERLHLR